MAREKLVLEVPADQREREYDESESNQPGDEPSRCGHANLPSVYDVALAIGARR
jgi:hypothetical protein